jgi:arylformamidase
MKVFDLSHLINQDMPVYPGTEKPELINAMTIELHGFAEKKISIYSHVGTHIDAPGHILESGETLDKFHADKYFGRACKVDLTNLSSNKIDLPLLKKSKSLFEKAEFILLNTGWSKYWNTDLYFTDFPTLTAEAAEWLCGFPIKGIGVDTISVDCCNSTNMPIHKILMSHKKIIIENLNNLLPLPENNFFFTCLPLKIEDADGSPVRAAAILFNNKDFI